MTGGVVHENSRCALSESGAGDVAVATTATTAVDSAFASPLVRRWVAKGPRSNSSLRGTSSGASGAWVQGYAKATPVRDCRLSGQDLESWKASSSRLGDDDATGRATVVQNDAGRHLSPGR